VSVDESFNSLLWRLERAAAVLNTHGPLIAPYMAHVLPRNTANAQYDEAAFRHPSWSAPLAGDGDGLGDF